MKPQHGTALTTTMLVLTVTTGMVEAVSFLVFGPVFTAVQTGNVLFLGFAAAGAGGFSAASASVSLAGFAVGGLLSSRFESYRDALGRRWFVAGLLVESVLLGLAALAAWLIDRFDDEPLGGRHLLVISLLALAMGMRNMSTMRADVPDLPTTVTTRAVTAFVGGSPFAPDSRILSGRGRELHRAGSIAAMVGGGLLGAWMLGGDVRPSVVLLVTTAVVLSAALGFGLVPRYRAPSPAEPSPAERGAGARRGCS